MILHSVTFKGFRSFDKEAHVKFDLLRGLVFVTGENQVEPALGANGIGKSTIFEAVFWTLFGRTSRGLKAGALHTWGSKELTEGQLTFTLNGHEYSLYRSWGPNALKLDRDKTGSSDVDQDSLEKELGVSPRAFLYSRFFAQFVPSFLDIGATQQLDLFTEVLALTKWEDASDRAGTQARVYEQSVAKIELSIARERGSISERNKTLELMEDVMSKEARLMYVAAVAGKNKVCSKKTAEQSLEKLAKAELKKVEVDNSKVDALITELAETLTAVHAKRDAMQIQCERLKRELGRHTLAGTTMSADTCPACGQHVNRIDARKAHAQVVLGVTKLLDEELTRMGIHDKKSAVIRTNLNEAKALRIDVDSRAAAAAERVWQQAVKDTERAQLELSIVLSYKSTTSEVYDKAVAESQQDLAGLKKQIQARNTQQKAFEGCKFWQKEFKEVRLFLVEESLMQLEVEANSALHQLGLVGWSITFDIESENRSGSIRRGFSVLVRSPDTDEPVPWEVWSGGESQRLRLAATMGLSNLINQRLGMDSNIEFWDEPSTWLSTSGIADLMTTLKSRSETTGRVVVVADHRALEFGGFDHIMEVVKDAGGSRIK